MTEGTRSRLRRSLFRKTSHAFVLTFIHPNYLELRRNDGRYVVRVACGICGSPEDSPWHDDRATHENAGD